MSEQKFWSIVLLLITQVRPLEVCALLTTHPKANSDMFRDVRQLLTAMPLEISDLTSIESRLSCFTITSSLNLASWQKSGSFEKVWQHWQSVCNIRLMEMSRSTLQSDNIDAQYLLLILSIMAGRQDCWNDPRIIDACGPWYFRFVAWLFYTNHFVDVSSLSSLMDLFKSKFDIQSKPSTTCFSAVRYCDEFKCCFPSQNYYVLLFTHELVQSSCVSISELITLSIVSHA